jgi:hypothetical protein
MLDMGDTGQTSCDYDRLRRSATGVLAAHQQATGQSQNFQNQSYAQGAWWNPDNDGNDIIGITFGSVYTPVVAQAFSNTQENLDALQRYGQGMHVTADNHESADDATTESVAAVANGGNGNGR